METKLLVKNEHGEFEIRVGDKVRWHKDEQYIDVVLDFTNEYIIRGRFGAMALERVWESYKRIEWTNGLGNKEVAWEGDKIYHTLYETGLGYVVSELKISQDTNNFDCFFTERKKACEYINKLCGVNENANKERNTTEREMGDFDKLTRLYNSYQIFAKTFLSLDKIMTDWHKTQMRKIPEGEPFIINGNEYKWKEVRGSEIIYQNHK